MATSARIGGFGRSGLLARVRSAARQWHATALSDPNGYRILVESLFSSPTSLLLSNTVGVLVPLFCWYASGLQSFIWLSGAAAGIVVLRACTIMRYRRRRGATLPTRFVLALDREYFVGATSYSLVLGAANFVALADTDSVPCHIITIVCGIAFASGYVARNSGRPRFAIVQLLCFCIPMAAGLSMAVDPFYQVIALYIVLFAATNISVIFSLNRNLLQLAAATKESRLLATSLSSKNETLDTALNSMTHGLCMFGPDLCVEVFNSRFLDLYGLSRAGLAAGSTLKEVVEALGRTRTLTRHSATELRSLCQMVAETLVPGEREIVAENGKVLVVTVDVTPAGGLLLLTEDASSRKAAAAQIERMAHCDTLTGLPNRFRFGEVLKAALQSGPALRRVLALFYVDLDDFKGVNDTMGHEAGDHLLEKVAARLQSLVTGSGLVARFGGDEFLLLLDVSSGEDALAMGRRIIAEISNPLDVNGTVLHITTSVGIALGPEHGTEPSELLRAADMALYAAKAKGRNTALLYAPMIAEALSHRRQMETDLRDATRSGLLSLYYQPIVDARTDEVRSYEALMRWNHPEKGMIPPTDFIPIAEQTGLIAEMGSWALRRACEDALRWPESISVAVNVSAFQFKEPAKLIQSVKDALKVSGLAPTRLELEVTESLLIENQEATLQAIRDLREIGVKISLDDFGTGYSSLGYLACYPFSKVKIDRSFAAQITTDSSSRSIIEVVCQLARKLGMRVVVEGIECEAQRREIVMLGAEQAQGWLFGKPEPIESVATLRRDAA